MKVATFAAECDQLLKDFAFELTALGVPVPDVQYIAAGQVPWDGESLTVALAMSQQGQPGQPFQGTYVAATPTQLMVSLNVQLCREVSVAKDGIALTNLPTEAEMAADGALAMTDAAGLLLAAVRIHAAYLDTDPGEGFSIGELIPLGPEGGLAAVRLTIHLSLS